MGFPYKLAHAQELSKLTRVRKTWPLSHKQILKMPSIDDKNETEDEDMEQDTPESEKSDDEIDSDTGSGSDEDEQSGK